LRKNVSLTQVKSFWENNPLCTLLVKAEPGSKEFFSRYDRLREINEPVEFAQRLHEYDRYKGKRVLEVGCGNAYTLAKYAQAGAEIYGIDITEAAIRISKKRFEYFKLKGDFRTGNAEDLPYESDFFHCICSMGVLHHIPHPEKAVGEIYRCLKPGGKLIIMLYNKNSLNRRLFIPLKSFLRRKSIRQVVNEVDGIGNPKGDVYSKKDVEKLLNKFKDIKTSIGCLSQKIFSFFPQSFVLFLAKKWGWFLYAKAMK
jgi:ubiquinone/menaquinone biosynthesis C-methylase UbiE